ncbi:CapA family protein [Flindersiella endophytica]
MGQAVRTACVAALAALLAGCTGQEPPSPGSVETGRETARRTASGSPTASATPRTTPPPPTVTVSIVGDLMFGRRVGTRMARTGDYALPLRPTASQLAGADITVGNLESTLARLGGPTQDDAFSADPKVLTGLTKVGGFDVLSLANNHTGDFGERSLLTTVRLVRESGILPVGAGANLGQAWTPAIVERNGVRFGFLAFNAIGETPAAGARSPGAATIRMPPRTGPLSGADLRRAQRAVRALAAQVDVTIVLPHWGAQYTHRPVADQRTVGRALVDAGADAVVGGHPHWTQPVERHRGRPIVHSLGNFVFDMDWEPQVHQGNVAELTFTGERLDRLELLPYRIELTNYAPVFVSGARR